MTRHVRLTSLEPVLGQLELASTTPELQEIIERLRDAFSIDHMVYHWVNAKGSRLGVGTYPEKWVQRYIACGYLRIDPVIIGCFNRFHPVDWKQLDWSSRSARDFQLDAIQHGIGNQGLSIPIRGPHGQYALFTASHTCEDGEWEGFIESNRKELILLGHFFNKKMLDMEADQVSELFPNLSPREQETLTLLALGYSRAQVAQTMSISEHTLRVYVEGARLKLGAHNTLHAVSLALSRGIVIV